MRISCAADVTSKDGCALETTNVHRSVLRIELCAYGNKGRFGENCCLFLPDLRDFESSELRQRAQRK